MGPPLHAPHTAAPSASTVSPRLVRFSADTGEQTERTEDHRRGTAVHAPLTPCPGRQPLWPSGWGRGPRPQELSPCLNPRLRHTPVCECLSSPQRLGLRGFNKGFMSAN